MEEYPLISVIVLSWNGCRFLEQCLDSVMAQTYPHLEIIVPDNGSTDGSVELVKDKFRRVHLIENGENLGYSGGNNAGIRASHGDYIMILNNDARLDPHCIEELKRSIDKHERFGACAAKILLEDEDRRIDSAGLLVCPDGLSIGRGRLEREDLYSEETEVFFSSGCASLFYREMLEDIGLYDEDFFAYAEDTDLGWRARLAGWRCIYTPRAVVYHHHSASAGAYSHMKAYLVERNRIWVAIKNFPIPILLASPFYTLWRYAWQAYGAFTGAGAAGRFTRDFSKEALLGVLIKVFLTFWRGLPLMLKKRKEVQGKRRISTWDVYSLLKRYGISAKEVALKE